MVRGSPLIGRYLSAYAGLSIEMKDVLIVVRLLLMFNVHSQLEYVDDSSVSNRPFFFASFSAVSRILASQVF